MTRRRFCELVEIHPTTLRRWETAGVVRPKMSRVMGISTAVFNEDDVKRGLAVTKLLRDSPGTLSLDEAARRARRGGDS